MKSVRHWASNNKYARKLVVILRPELCSAGDLALFYIVSVWICPSDRQAHVRSMSDSSHGRDISPRGASDPFHGVGYQPNVHFMLISQPNTFKYGITRVDTEWDSSMAGMV